MISPATTPRSPSAYLYFSTVQLLKGYGWRRLECRSPLAGRVGARKTHGGSEPPVQFQKPLRTEDFKLLKESLSFPEQTRHIHPLAEESEGSEVAGFLGQERDGAPVIAPLQMQQGGFHLQNALIKPTDGPLLADLDIFQHFMTCEVNA